MPRGRPRTVSPHDSHTTAALFAVDLPRQVCHVRREAPVEPATETRVRFRHDRFADVPAESQAEPGGVPNDELDEWPHG